MDEDPWTSQGVDFMLRSVSDRLKLSCLSFTHSTFSELSHVMLELESYEGGWVFDADD